MANYNGFSEINKVWDYMVTDHAHNRNRDVTENKKMWNDFLCDPAFFGYSRMFKEVLSGRKVVVGSQELSIPYFVVRDSISEEDLFVMDVKKYDSVPEAQDVNQLKFCLNNFGVDYSVLVCDKIYIYDRANSIKDVSFTPNNPEGIRFIDAFSYNNLRPGSGFGTGSDPQPGPRPGPRFGGGALIMTKSEAINIFRGMGFRLESKTTTFASLNSSSDIFWANPNIELLQKHWDIIFNDTSSKTLYLAHIPAFSISRSQVKVRADRPWRIDLEIEYASGRFIDTRSGVEFGGYIKNNVEYTD